MSNEKAALARELIGSLSADYVVAIIPRIGSSSFDARYVDPATAVAVIKAAVEIWKGAELKKWQNSVSTQLDEINAKLDQVLSELRTMRVYIREELLQQTTREFRLEIEGRRANIQDILAGSLWENPKESDRDRIFQNLEDLKNSLTKLTAWQDIGFSQYSAVASGIATTLLVLKVTERTKEETRSFAKRMASFFANAIDPSIPTSIAAARNWHASEVIRLSQILDGRLNRWWVSNYGVTYNDMRRPPGEPRPIHHYYLAHPQGSIEHGFTRQFKEHIGRNPGAHWYPEIPEKYDLGDGAEKAWQNINGNLEHYRTSILSAMATEAHLQIVVTELAKIHNELGSL